MDRFKLLSFRPSAEPGARYRLLTGWVSWLPDRSQATAGAITGL